MSKSKKMKLDSMDVVEEKRRRLKSLFPEVFTDDKIDFEQLKRTLGEMGGIRTGKVWPQLARQGQLHEDNPATLNSNAKASQKGINRRISK